MGHDWTKATRRALPALRAVLLVLCAGLSVTSSRATVALPWLLVLAGAATVAAVLPTRPLLVRGALVVEVVGSALAVAYTGGGNSPLLPYLLAPAFAAGLFFGLRGAILASGWAAAVLVPALLLGPERGTSLQTELTGAAQWPVIALLLGLLAAWVRTLIQLTEHAADAAYAEAYRLLSDLHAVARELPETLDSSAAGAALLDACRELVDCVSGTVYVHEADDLTALHAFGVAARPGQVGVDPRIVELPVVLEDERLIGVVVLETTGGTIDAALRRELEQAVSRLALRLDTALLFDSLRRTATQEERHRLAREIHDGIAQELVYVGYELDNVAGEIDRGRPTALESARALRKELTRIVSELRLSIFDLKTTVPAEQGLAGALGDYIRAVAAATGITVHLTLSTGESRLPRDTEVELLRIAQEAIATARRRAGARNIWVSLTVAPPRAVLRVEDDGDKPPGEGAVELEVLLDRAKYLPSDVAVVPRQPTGTLVEVVLHGSG